MKDINKGYLIGGIIAFVILAVFFSLGCYMLSLQLKANSYTKTRAVVIGYVLRYETDYNDDHKTNVPTYYNVVEYEFDGEKYQKTCDTPASTYSPPNEQGNITYVFVNPKNPNEVVFRNSTHIIFIVISYIVSVVGFVCIVLIFHKARKDKRELKEYNEQQQSIQN